MRTTYDFAPLWRSTIGFDRLLDLVNAAQQASTEDNYPPCNVQRVGEDRYQISLAVAGFAPDDIAITAEQSVLTMEGRKAENNSANSCTMEFRRGLSSGSSIWRTMSRSRELHSTTACCRSNWCARSRRP